MARAKMAIAVLLASHAIAPRASADSAAEAAAAEALFREGRALLGDGKTAQACEKFAESKRLDPAPGTMLNLARCYDDLGRTASAWATYRELFVRATQLGQTARASFAAARAAELATKLPTLTITANAATTTEGLVVRVDGTELGAGAWGSRVPVDPGRHRVGATAPGRLAWSSDIDVASSSNTAVDVPELARLELDRESGGRLANPVHVGGLITTLVGATAIGAALVTRGAANMDRDAAHDLCVGGCSPEGRFRRARGDDFATTSTILLLSGVALVLGGTAIALLTPAKRTVSAVGR